MTDEKRRRSDVSLFYTQIIATRIGKMFSFMRKDKEDKKKPKKEAPKREKKKLTAEDLNRLEEVRRSYFGRKKRKDKDTTTPSPTSPSLTIYALPDEPMNPHDSGSIRSDTASPEPSREGPGISRSSSEPGPGKPPIPPKPRPRGLQKLAVPPAGGVQTEKIAEAKPKKGGGDAAQAGESLGESYPRSATFSMDLRLPRLTPARVPRPRTLTVPRQPAGDFGFSLRRAVMDPGYSAEGERARVVFFAEPGAQVVHSDTGLLPGDRLLEVNGVSVADRSREEIVELIKASGTTVSLRVQTVPELAELTARAGDDANGSGTSEDSCPAAGTLARSGSRRHLNVTARTEDQVADQRAWLDSERVWVLYKGGFAAARLRKRSDDETNSASSSAVRVQLEHNEEVIEVDEEDVEKANPPNLDRAEDLAQLRYLNESSVLHTLCQRYAASLIHTYAGNGCLVVLNPMRNLALYSEKVMQLFRGCKREEVPPHVYATAQDAYRNLLTSRTDQAIIFAGRSGAGKTTNFRHVLYYLCNVASPVNKIVSPEKLMAIHTLMEAFGNAKTAMNTNATRFTQIFSLDFDHAGLVANASVQVLMLDKSRVVKRFDGETSFSVFYQMQCGADEVFRKEFHLNDLPEQNMFFPPLQRQSEEKQKASVSWLRAIAALELLGVTPEEAKAVWAVLATIVHLGAAGAIKGASDRGQFVNPKHAQLAASLLGTTVEELARAVFHNSSSTLQPRSSFRTAPNEKAFGCDPVDCLEGMATGLYCEAFNAVVSLINRSLSTNHRTNCSILVVDSPGFQNPASCGRHSGASFEDLCYNYVQERLQLLFHERTLVAHLHRYAQERIECNLEGLRPEGDPDGQSPEAVVEVVDRPSQQAVLRASNLDLRSPADRRGLLWLLDEDAVTPGATDESFLDRILLQNCDLDGSLLVKKGALPGQLVLRHLLGTNPVTYNVHGWLKCARENPVVRHAASLLQDSRKDGVCKLFVASRGPASLTMSGALVGIDGTASIRRASSIRRTAVGSAGVKRRSACLQIKFQTDAVIETLRRTRLHFVHCLLPQHNAGLCELNTSLLMPTKTSSWEEIFLNVPLLRSQIRGVQIMDVARIHKQGYPEHLSYSEFLRRFELLASTDSRSSNTELDSRKAVECLLGQLDVDRTQYKMGLSQVFFRSGVLPQLEEHRDEKLHDSVIRFQAVCRGYLARKKAEKLKVQDVAIRCVQRNVRKLQAIRNWPWWRLWVRILPLLNVHRAEEELRAKSEELALLLTKVDKLERDRAELKHENDRLEAKVSELTADLAEEHATATHASEMFEAENIERTKLEKELQELRLNREKLQRINAQTEMELMEMRMLRSSETNGDLSDNDDDATGVYKHKYECAVREMEFAKKKLQQQHEDDLEQQHASKKALDRKLSEALDEADRMRQTVGQWKRKVQRLNAEMNDLKIMLDEQTARNETLEKKQRKFDLELSTAQDESRQERSHKERIQRERDLANGEKYSLEQDLHTLKLELEMRDEKIKALTKELDELAYGGRGEEEVIQLKRARHDMELKVKDQEEELDDLAGQVQMLEQAKVRLEMSLENMRKEHRKEMSQKDEEIEETRNSAQKKLKALEQQLENEHDDRQALIREKHELERRCVELQERPVMNQDIEAMHRLRKDLKRTKALLRDAQLMLERSKDDAPTKALIRQLKNQLEDAEFAKTAAIRARQGAELELQELQSQLEDMSRSRADCDAKYAMLAREKNALQSEIEENEEEMTEVMRKYKAAVSQLSADQSMMTERAAQILDLETERNSLKDQLQELSGKLELLEVDTTSSHEHNRLEMKVRDLESKLELELTTRSRLDVQLSRLKETVEKLTDECEAVRSRERQAIENNKKLQRQLREVREDLTTLEQKEMETSQRRRELEMSLENSEAENQTVKSDLKLALKRIEDLRAAMDDNAESDDTVSEGESDSDVSDSGLDAFLAQHRESHLGVRTRLSSLGGRDYNHVTSGASSRWSVDGSSAIGHRTSLDLGSPSSRESAA